MWLHWNNFVFANVCENHTCPSRCRSHSLNVTALNSSQLTRRLWSVFDSCFLILWHFRPKPPAHQQREREKPSERERDPRWTCANIWLWWHHFLFQSQEENLIALSGHFTYVSFTSVLSHHFLNPLGLLTYFVYVVYLQ